MVVFATPKMLYASLSLNIFKRWFTDEKNMIIMPGYCVPAPSGTRSSADSGGSSSRRAR